MRILGTIASSSREVPNAPTIGTATDVGVMRPFNNGSPTTAGGAASVTFTAPSWTGGLPVTSYTVKAYNTSGVYQNLSASGSYSPITVTGLLSSTQYKYAIYATNSIGNSTESAFSNTVTATTVPQAPTIGTATAGNASASVAFTANATGGSVITSYTVTSSPGGLTGSGASSPITVSGLTNGTAYTFTVKATNANGASDASSASNSITPAPPVPVVSGGTLYSDSTYYYRAFTTSSTLTITNSNLVCDYYMVAGGGAGGIASSKSASRTSRAYWRINSGGGGGGGYLYKTSQTLSPTSYTVTVGAGGSSGTNGSNTTFNSFTALGGGSGSAQTSSSVPNTGGSGGGGSGGYTGNTIDPDATSFYQEGGLADTTYGTQGNKGGAPTAYGDASSYEYGAGGGGGAYAASTAWVNGSIFNAMIGGTCITAGFTVSGLPSQYSGGGGGACGQGGNGANGGGGGGGAGSITTDTAGTAGTANTGGGAGGTKCPTQTNPATVTAGASGGSGIFVMRYTRSQVGG